ncbi:MAG: IS630 family transposase [Bdellovibrionaceae bacterium]|nr:IS630 family transposase [Pseudobdellovibrionaceae bacterium]
MISDARSLDPKSQERIRYQAIEALKAGYTQVEVAEMYGVTRQAVYNWNCAYKESGKKSLRAKPQGRPKEEGKLKGWQCAQIVRIIQDKTPDQLKFDFVLWTREAVQELIKDKYGIEYSKWTVGRLLKKWGFTPQKPVRRAYEQNDVAVIDWLKSEYPKIRQKARKSSAEIHWGDETGLRSDASVAKTYGRKGVTPIVKLSGKRFSCNVISSITNQGRLSFKVFDGKFNADVFIDFMKRLIKSSRRKIFLIVDRHPVHYRSKQVKSWISKNKKAIELFFLPPYSPELNPNELLNNDLKRNTVRKKRASNKDELIKTVRSHLRSRQKTPYKIKNLFEKTEVSYAKAV